MTGEAVPQPGGADAAADPPPTETATTSNLARAVAYIRKNGAGVGLEILVNFVAPFLIYDYGRHRLGDVHALMAASGPPIAWSLVQFARTRRLDAVSVMVISGIALSLLGFIGGGGVKFLQLRENLVGGLVGLVFIGSAVIGKPLMYELARASMRRRSEAQAASFETMNQHAGFRRTMRVMTLVWGFGMIVQTALACALVFSISIRNYLLVSPFVGYGVIGLLALWTILYVRHRRRLGAARAAATDAAVGAGPPGSERTSGA